ncbi:cobalamin-dependent protein [Candidatus Viridilinea mediisalina]|uniref:B12-binding domain-containing protein n=1 Tax=Candidatus Viridilinea mediisalina TaxID=2024553 RepID=A0A2A6RK55_9CHLR|nr:cobalamin-dependent protein [Candidatus Viridilinea mediisalina]PDW03248.1 hypothetical protein CJ255_09695 [Candidatus Viridilinea mediisalina]
MTQPAAATLATRGAGPSLFKLVSHLPEERRWRRPADALIVLSRQLTGITPEQSQNTDLAIGTLRFSLFRMHQARISQIASLCRSVTVYGEADTEPPSIPNVQFVPVARGAALSQEWFVMLDSPVFWGALIANVVAEPNAGAGRRLIFDGVLTSDERVVSRAGLLLSLTRGAPAPIVAVRDRAAQAAHWAQIAFEMANHAERDRHDLLGCLNEVPDLLMLLQDRELPMERLFGDVVEALMLHHESLGSVLYRYENGQLNAVAASSNMAMAPAHPQSAAIQALQQGAMVLRQLAPGDADQQLIPEAQSVAAVPVMIGGGLWGVLLVGQSDPDPASSHTADGAVALSTLLARILEQRGVIPPKSTNGAASGFPSVGDALADAFADATDGFPQSDTPAPPPAFPAPPTVPGFPAPSAPPSALPATPTPPAAPATPPPAPPAASPPVAGSPAAAGGFSLPGWMRPTSSPAPAPAATPAPAQGDGQPYSWASLRARMMSSLVNYDQQTAEQIWRETCALYTPETICTELLAPLQIDVGDAWHRGEVSVASEHFTSRFVQTKLLNLLNASASAPGGPLAVVGCTQGELHEIGAIMLSLFLRWSGFQVVYLGQSVPNSTIEEMIEHLRPQIVALSASTINAANSMAEVGKMIENMGDPRPIFLCGGIAFQQRPSLRTLIPTGVFPSGDLRSIVNQITTLVHERWG